MKINLKLFLKYFIWAVNDSYLIEKIKMVICHKDVTVKKYIKLSLKKMICVKECETGFYGPNCTKQCPHGTYGMDCQQKCSCGNKDCNHVFGCFKGRVTLLKDNVPIENCINN